MADGINDIIFWGDSEEKSSKEENTAKKVDEAITSGKNVIVKKKKAKRAKKSDLDEEDFKVTLSKDWFTGTVDKSVIDTGQYTWNNVPTANTNVEYIPMADIWNKIKQATYGAVKSNDNVFEVGDIVQHIGGLNSEVFGKIGVVSLIINDNTVLVSWSNYKAKVPININTKLHYGDFSGYYVDIKSLKMLNKGKDNIKEEKEQIKLNHPKVIFKNDKLGDLYECNLIASYKPLYGYKLNDNEFLIYEDVKIIEGIKLSYRFKIYKKSELKTNYNKIGDNALNRFYSSPKAKEEYKIKEIEDTILQSCIVLIKKSQDSSKSFGFGPTKREMVGKYYKIDNITYNVFNKETNKNESLITIKNEKLGKSLKFYLSDVEIIIPSPNSWLKSYNLPKDRTIKIGSNVKLVNNKNLKLDKNTKLLVHSIKGEKQYIAIPISDFKTGIRYHKEKVNPNCPVVCKNDKGEVFKLKMKQIKVI